MNGKNSDTPRTDEAEDVIRVREGEHSFPRHIVEADFARQLELESVSLEARVKELEKDRERYANALGYVVESHKRTEWKPSMSRIAQVCEMTLAGHDMMDVLRDPARALLQPANTHPSQTQEKKP